MQRSRVCRKAVTLLFAFTCLAHEVQYRKVFGSPQRDASVTVFYNLYVPLGKKGEERDSRNRILAIVQEQLEMVQPDRRIYINSIGTPHLEIAVRNATILKHYTMGNEVTTLYDVWKYCRENEEQDVIYLHDKGSFHNTDGNNRLRRYVTEGATSGECARMSQLGCNFCVSRMSPLPHPHTSGNMWRAQCGYVAKLLDPQTFEGKMSSVPDKGIQAASCKGKQRYSAEHWILSHPDAVPCDVDPTRGFLFGHPGDSNNPPGKGHVLPPRGFSKVLSRAPRFNRTYYRDLAKTIQHNKKYIKKASHKCLVDAGLTVQERLQEYAQLFGPEVQPKDSWWGWKSLLNSSAQD